MGEVCLQDFYKKTTKVLLRILLISVIVSFFLEIAFVIMKYADGILKMKEVRGALLVDCVLPTFFATMVYIGSYFILDSPNVSIENKRYTTFSSIALVCFAIIVFHSEYPVLYGLFVVPIMFSSIYGEKKYIRQAMEVCLLLQLIVIAVNLMFTDGLTLTSISECLLSVIVLLFTMYFANITRTYVEMNGVFIEKNMQEQSDLNQRISVDAMTGLFNHTAFYSELEKKIRESDRTNQNLCIAVVDIDNFKHVNDTYGHSSGDEVLIYLSKLLKDICKEQIVCRYGGEEFSVIFTDKSLKESVSIMQEVLDVFSNHEFEWCDRKITFSCGVCKHYDIRVNAEELFRQADKYLYKAKNEGKNRIVSE